jgi:hypothetical protein
VIGVPGVIHGFRDQAGFRYLFNSTVEVCDYPNKLADLNCANAVDEMFLATRFDVA